MLPKVLEQWKASPATGQMFDMEFPLRGVDGIFRPFLTGILPLKDVAGNILQWFGTNTDVTERKRAEQKREMTAEFLQLMNKCKGTVALLILPLISSASAPASKPLASGSKMVTIMHTSNQAGSPQNS